MDNFPELTKKWTLYLGGTKLSVFCELHKIEQIVTKV